MKLSPLFAYSILIFVVMAGCGLTYFYPNNNPKTEQKTTNVPFTLMSNLDNLENTSQPISGLLIIPRTLSPKPDSFGNVPNSSSSQTATTESPKIDQSANNPNPKLGIYENDPTKGQPRPLQAIDWSRGGPITPGKSRNSPTAFIRNEGSVPFKLDFSIANWELKNLKGDLLSADHQQYFKITWSYDNSTLTPNETIPIFFTLTIASNIADVATFRFDIIATPY